VLVSIYDQRKFHCTIFTNWLIPETRQHHTLHCLCRAQKGTPTSLCRRQRITINLDRLIWLSESSLLGSFWKPPVSLIVINGRFGHDSTWLSLSHSLDYHDQWYFHLRHSLDYHYHTRLIITMILPKTRLNLKSWFWYSNQVEPCAGARVVCRRLYILSFERKRKRHLMSAFSAPPPDAGRGSLMPLNLCVYLKRGAPE
jgi:hypothetical protein